MSKFVYRAIREDENPNEGLRVGVEKASTLEERAKRFFYHINNGSNEAYTEKYFISMTEKLEAAQKYRDKSRHEGTGILLINAEAIQSDLIYIKGVEKSELASELSSSALVLAQNYSAADSEVLTDTGIEPEYIKELSPLMLDTLEAINVTIAKGDDESQQEKSMLEFVQSAYFDSPEFERVLENTGELNVYEQYFYERYYKHGYSREQILSEMNNLLTQSGKGKAKLDLTTVESLRVSVIKKLLNSDETIEYLQKYNDEKYHDDSIGEQLQGIKEEKAREKTSTVDKDKDIKRRKIAVLKSSMDKLKADIKELETRVKELRSKVDELTEESKTNKQDFYGNLQANIYPPEVEQFNAEIIKLEAQIKSYRKKILTYESKEIELKKENIALTLPSKSRKIAARFHGVIVKDGTRESVLSDRQLKTTDSPATYTKMEQSNGVIANGETSFYTVPLTDELSYTAGVTSAIRSNGRGTCLITFASKYRRKEQGGPKNKERIGRTRVQYGIDTEFGLDEIAILRKTRGEEFSSSFKTKYGQEIERYDRVKEAAVEELRIEMNKKRERV